MELTEKMLSQKQLRSILSELNSVNIMQQALATNALVDLLIMKGVFTEDEFNQSQDAANKSEDGEFIKRSRKAFIAQALLEVED